MDDRAQAIGIARLFLALLVGAIVIFIVNTVGGKILDHAGQSGSGQVATTGTNYMTQAMQYLPIAFLFISFFGLIAYSVYSRGATT